MHCAECNLDCEELAIKKKSGGLQVEFSNRHLGIKTSCMVRRWSISGIYVGGMDQSDVEEEWINPFNFFNDICKTWSRSGRESSHEDSI